MSALKEITKDSKKWSKIKMKLKVDIICLKKVFFKTNKTYFIKNNENKDYAINDIFKLALSNYNENY